MADLTTLANARAWMGNVSTTDDELLTALVSRVSEWVQTWLNRDILTASYSEKWNGTGGQLMVFPNYPVTAVSALSIDGVSIPVASGTLTTSSGYAFDSTTLYLSGYLFTRGFLNVAVTYTAGFSTVPVEMEQAVLELVAYKYREKDRTGQSSKQLMQGETIAFITKDMPDHVRSVLNNYRKVFPG